VDNFTAHCFYQLFPAILSQTENEKEIFRMSTKEPIATGLVEALAVNGVETKQLAFAADGPVGDVHQGFTRVLSGHDGGYIRTSGLVKGSQVFNWRSWTGLSAEEMVAVGYALGRKIPVGCLLENITFSGILHFSKLVPGTRLVFPCHGSEEHPSQVILAVWEENGPCKTVGARLEQLYPTHAGLKTEFVRAAQGRRGVMGFVLSAGHVYVGDTVTVFPPIR